MSDSPPEADRLPPGPDPRTGLVRKVLIGAVVGALVFAAMALYADAEKLARTATIFSLRAFGLGLAFATANYGLRVARWQYYLRHLNIHVPLGESSLIFLSGFVMSVTPGKVGEVFKSLLLHESRGTSFARSAPIVIAERLTDLIALVLWTALGALAFAQGPLIAGAGAVVVLGILLVATYRPLGELALRLTARMPVLKLFSDRLREAYESLYQMTRPAPLAIGTVIAVIAWGLECVSMYVIVHGFQGVAMSWDAATFTYAASTLVGALAMLPGGLGGTELAMTGLLQELGDGTVTPEIATATTMLVRIATLWWAVLVGVMALAGYRLLVRGRGTTSASPGRVD